MAHATWPQLPDKPAHLRADAPVPEIQSFQAENNSVVLAKKVQSLSDRKPAKTTEKQDDDWRFEIKRKSRNAGRKNAGSTAKASYYYWVIRVRKSDGETVYYGTLDVLDEADPRRLERYWRQSKKRKVSQNA